jgi:hypothetical protein
MMTHSAPVSLANLTSLALPTLDLVTHSALPPLVHRLLLVNRRTLTPNLPTLKTAQKYPLPLSPP